MLVIGSVGFIDPEFSIRPLDRGNIYHNDYYNQNLKEACAQIILTILTLECILKTVEAWLNYLRIIRLKVGLIFLDVQYDSLK